MNLEEILLENARMKTEIEKIKEKIDKKNEKKREYYKTHREEHIQRVQEYQSKTNYNQNIPEEKKKEYARTAYLNKKMKKEKEKEKEKETI